MLIRPLFADFEFTSFVIPAKAGIHHGPVTMDAGFRRHDNESSLCPSIMQAL